MRFVNGERAIYNRQFESLGHTRCRCFVDVTDRRTVVDWAYVVKELADVRYTQAEKIVLVMDNLNTHGN